MKRYEKGQGLVEYALILALVALVVIAVVNLMGPSIGGIFCEINNTLMSAEIDYWPILSESMAVSDEFVTIDLKPYFHDICLKYTVFGDVDTFPSSGTVENDGDGIFKYWPNDAGSGTDDSFTFSWHFFDQTVHTGLVTIIVGGPDLLVSEANIMSSAKQTVQELDDVEEAIFTLLEAAADQEESLEEGVDLGVEAVIEGLEVLIDYADNNANQVLSESLSQLMQEVKDGNLDAIPAAITQIGSDLGEAPLEIWLAMLLKMAPRLIDSCVVVSEGSVSPDTIAVALQAVEELDENHPGRAEALQLLQVAVDDIEGRNNAIEEYSDFQSTVLGMFIAGLEFVGEEDLAEQLAADSEACGN